MRVKQCCIEIIKTALTNRGVLTLLIVSTALGGLIGIGAVALIFISRGMVVNITYGIYIFVMCMAVQALAALLRAVVAVNQDPVRVLRTP